LPSRRHSGCVPPAIEICVCPVAAGNGRTYTSNVPDSSDAYATQRVFGEKRAWASLNGVLRNVLALCSPVNVKTPRAYPRVVNWQYSRSPPSLDTSLGDFAPAAGITSSAKGSSGPPPIVFWKIVVTPMRFDPKKRRPPSAVQTGNQSVAGSDVRREVVPRASPRTQISGCAVAASVIPTATLC